MAENAVDSGGDRFADIVENVKLHESIVHVIGYVKDITKNDPTDTDAQICMHVLKSLESNTSSAIGDSIA